MSPSASLSMASRIARGLGCQVPGTDELVVFLVDHGCLRPQQRVEPSENADAKPADGCHCRQGYLNQRPTCLPKRKAML
jgi:hypothetical protein